MYVCVCVCVCVCECAACMALHGASYMFVCVIFTLHFAFKGNSLVSTLTVVGMVSVHCCDLWLHWVSRSTYLSVCYDVRVVYRQMRAPSLSLSLCLPSLIVVG